VGAITINGGGIFAPGPLGTPGTMTVLGNLAFQSGALYVVQLNPSNASNAYRIAGGTATLAGTAQAVFAPGSYASRTYTILTAAGGLAGTTFNALSTSNLPAGFTANLSYTASDVILNLTAALGISGLNGNQRNVANALNNFFNNGGTLPPAFVNVFGLTGGNLGNALTALSGESATGSQQVGFQLTNQFLSLMLDPFVDGRSGGPGAGGPALGFAPEQEELPEDPRSSSGAGIALAYASVLKAPSKPVPPGIRPALERVGCGLWRQQPHQWRSDSQRQRRSLRARGGLCRRVRLPADAQYCRRRRTRWRRHQLGPGAGTRLRQERRFPSGRLRRHALERGLCRRRLRLRQSLDVDRPLCVRRRPSHRRFQRAVVRRAPRGRLSLPHDLRRLTPYAAMQAQSVHTPGYSETDVTGGGFALACNSRTGTDTRSELGTRFDRLIALYPGAALALRGRLAWAHDWVSDPTIAAAFQTLPGASFIVNGAVPANDSALVSTGAELRLANGVSVLGKFDGEFASHSSTYAGTGTVRYAW
jgi:Autotransporter beta-domain